MSSAFQDVSGSFPPRITLVGALLSSTVAGAKDTSSVDAGYPDGLNTGQAVSNNEAGRFDLVSGITVSGSAAKIAADQLEVVRGKLKDVQDNLTELENNSLSDARRREVRFDIKENLRDLEKSIERAGLGNINLLDGSNAQGIKLNLDTGEVASISTTPSQTVTGRDQRFDYNPREVIFQTTDLRAALTDLQNLEVSTFPDTEAANSSNGNLYSVQRFQAVVNQASTALTDFKKQLTQAALENVTIRDDGNGAISTSEQARQTAARLAQQLQQDGFNISASPKAVYFSLFA